MILIRSSNRGNLVVQSNGWMWVKMRNYTTTCVTITIPPIQLRYNMTYTTYKFYHHVHYHLNLMSCQIWVGNIGQHWVTLGMGNMEQVRRRHQILPTFSPTNDHRLFSHFLRLLFSRFLIEYSPPSFSSASFRHIFYSSLKNQILQILIFFVHIIYVEYSFHFQPPPLHNILIPSQYPQYPPHQRSRIVNRRSLPHRWLPSSGVALK